MYTFHEEIPPPKQYNELRKIAGWGPLEIKAVEQALPKSIYSVVAKEHNEIIAFARLVGDGKLCFYIQEIIVHPDHQRKGIADNFMKYILSYIGTNATKRSYIVVFAGKGLENFYKKYGFWERPTKVMGPGMMQFWNDIDFNKHFNSPEQVT